MDIKNNENEVDKINDNNDQREYKTAEYKRRAQRNYYHNRIAKDPEYRTRLNKAKNEWREANREHVNEIERLRKQRKRVEKCQVKEIEIISQNKHENILPVDSVIVDISNKLNLNK